jgi:putative flippase GtrA
MRQERFLKFAAVGGGVMLSGLAIMVVLVDWLGVNENLAYLVQTFVTVELNFFLNARITWPTRTWRGLRDSWLRFHGWKVTTMIASQALFAGLLVAVRWAGIHGVRWIEEYDYVVAYIGCVGIITLVNFMGNDRWVFHSSGNRR